MIEHLKGTLIKKEPTHLIIDVAGVGYGMDVSLKTSEALEAPGSAAELHTFLYVKEGIFELYGFNTLLEKQIFQHLISVSGIGPKVALRILSGLTPEALIQKILWGKTDELTALKGIGKKTAEVMVASLKSPLSKLNITESISSSSPSPNVSLDDACNALITLGVKENIAQKAVAQAVDKLGEDAAVSEIISTALQLV